MKTCAIVDAYSSGNLLAPEFIKKGYQVIHVRSKDYGLPIILHTFHPEDFFMDLPAGSMEDQMQVLQQHQVEFIIAGCEVGVEYADTLNGKMHLPGNVLSKSLARRNKYEMIEEIRKAGLHTARQIKTTSPSDAVAFGKSLHSFDIILKPERSSGTNLVFRAKSVAEAETAFRKIMHTKTMFDEPNEDVCVQEYIPGEEFVIDTVSSDGKHIISDMWQYHFTSENGVPFLYDQTELLKYDDPRTEPLKQYTLDVINALGVRWGPTHPEIKMSPSGPMVIEVGSRLAGVYPLCAQAALGIGPAQLTADAFCDPEEFMKIRAKPYDLTTNGLLISLIAYETGILKSLDRSKEIENLPSFHHMDFWVTVGKEVHKTIDIGTSPGFVFLMHTDKAVIQKDYEFVRNLERNGLYELA